MGLALLALNLFGWAFLFAAGRFAGSVIALLAAATIANQLCYRIFDDVNITEVGLPLNRPGLHNLSLGLGAGALCAGLVLLIPVMAGMAKFTAVSKDIGNTGTAFFVVIMLAFGALAEELLFRGYAFQILLRYAGPAAAVLPVGVLFAAVHSDNPHSSWLSLANTAGFGVAFGYAFLRTHDVWLPLGLHFGWNVALLALGSNISGLAMRITPYELAWRAGDIWSGGAYGPEGSALTSGMLVLLLIFLYKTRVHRQAVYLLDNRKEDV